MKVEQSVSVIIAAYNASKTLQRAVDSVIDQEVVQQIIIVDDCSSDDTLEIAKSYDNEKIVVLSTTENSGPSLARNLALKQCLCEWVAIIDADDFVDNLRFDKLLSNSEGYQLIADDQYRVLEGNEDGIRHTMIGNKASYPFDVDFLHYVDSNISIKGKEREELGFLKPIIHRDFIETHSLSFQENMRLGEDYEFYCRCLLLGAKFKVIKASGYVAVVRADSLSGNHSMHDLIQLRDCDTKLIQDYQLKGQELLLLEQHAASIDKKIQWISFYKSVKKIKIGDALSAFFTSKNVAIHITEQLRKEFHKRFILRSQKS